MESRESKIYAVRAALLRRGMTITSFSKKISVLPQAVSVFLRRWADKKERPRGKETARVISLLEEFVGFKICG